MFEMFSSLKNKIKEEKGAEVRFNNRGRLSSTVSISSIDEANLSEISSLRSQVRDLQIKLQSLNVQYEESNVEKNRLEKANEILLESVKVSQNQKELYCQEQEHIQNIQTDEIEKLKKLLSFREQEALDRLVSLQNNQQQIENLTSELERLKPLETMVEELQESQTKEIQELRDRLIKSEERLTEIAENSEKISTALRTQNSSLNEKYHDMTNQFEIEREEKITALLRNAEISQSEEILKKELRIERDEITELQEENNKMKVEITDLKNKVNDLEFSARKREDHSVENDVLKKELCEKNQVVRNLTQRLSDVKKEFQSNGKLATVPVQNLVPKKPSSDSGIVVMDDVNFSYLKHVIIKFLTSREMEARQLVKAVATLLHLSKEEEKLLDDTLSWKMSWFGSKPRHGSGQKAFAIPPS
ncbi:GOLGA1 family protein [Megaselia abdita]